MAVCLHHAQGVHAQARHASTTFTPYVVNVFYVIFRGPAYIELGQGLN